MPFTTLGADGQLIKRHADGSTSRVDLRQEMDVMVLLDCSSSMSGKSKLQQAKSGLLDSYVPEIINHGNRIGLIAFTSEAHLCCGLTEDAAVFERAVESLRADGSTYLVDALKLAEKQLVDVPAATTRCLLIATDGEVFDRDEARRVAKRLADAGYQIFTIGTEDADEDFLRDIATTEDGAIMVTSHQLTSGFVKAAGLLGSGVE